MLGNLGQRIGQVFTRATDGTIVEATQEQIDAAKKAQPDWMVARESNDERELAAQIERLEAEVAALRARLASIPEADRDARKPIGYRLDELTESWGGGLLVATRKRYAQVAATAKIAREAVEQAAKIEADPLLRAEKSAREAADSAEKKVLHIQALLAGTAKDASGEVIPFVTGSDARFDLEADLVATRRLARDLRAAAGEASARVVARNLSERTALAESVDEEFAKLVPPARRAVQAALEALKLIEETNDVRGRKAGRMISLPPRVSTDALKVFLERTARYSETRLRAASAKAKG